MYIFLVIVLVIVFALIFRHYSGTKKAYKDNVAQGLGRIQSYQGRIISAKDIDGLPDIVQKYLNYVGVVGKEMPGHFSIRIEGQMRFDRAKDWNKVSGSQVSFLDKETRLFHITMKMFGMPINALHHYETGKASMVIKILDLFKIIDNTGEIMDKSETVTYFNDMCIFAPATLIDADIEWEIIDKHSVLAHYTGNGITVSATLVFNEDGRLVNFISDDRYAIDANGKYEKIRWSTPLYEYQNFNGLNLVSEGEAIWHYDEGDFSYIKMTFIENSYE